VNNLPKANWLVRNLVHWSRIKLSTEMPDDQRQTVLGKGAGTGYAERAIATLEFFEGKAAELLSGPISRGYK
jgi:hypothetical protein